MQDYEKDILCDITAEATLVIPAVGLDMSRVAKQLLTFYADGRGLLIVLNAGRQECALLNDLDPSLVTNVSRMPVPQRRASYEGGGIFYGSSRVFIADFLNSTIDIKKISGVIVFNAELLQEDGRDAFVLHVFKNNNGLGFVMAFVHNITHLHAVPLAKIRTYTQTNAVSLYPRFHERLIHSLPDLPAAKVYIRQDSDIEEISLLLSDLIKGVFKSRYPGAGTMSCVSILVRYSACRELRLFRDLFYILFNCDSLSFYNYYKRALDAQLISGAQDTWAHTSTGCLLLEKAQVYLMSKIRRCRQRTLWSGDKRRKRSPVLDDCAQPTDASIDSCSNEQDENKEFECFVSQPPLGEVPADFDTSSSGSEDDSDSGLNKESDGPGCANNSANKSGENANRADSSTCCGEVSEAMTLPNKRLEAFYLANKKIKKLADIIALNKPKNIICMLPTRILKPLFTNIVRHVLGNTDVRVCTCAEFNGVEERGAEVVILVGPDLRTIRAIESNVPRNTHCRIYILTMKDSLEEQLYLSEIKEEKTIFERFIEEKTRLPLANPPEILDIGDEPHAEQMVTIDSREMMARLPYYLYRAGNTLDVRTLRIGDYVFGAKCIERKAIEDLRGSLNTGRLYSQARRMAYAYSAPILLVEFENGLPTLLAHETAETFSKSLIAKLCLFLVNFNTFKVLWTNSAVFSVQIIRDMQKREETEESYIGGIDPTLYEILLCIPGISSFNIKHILREYSSLEELAHSSIGRLESVLKDKERAQSVYNFFRESL